MAPTIRFTRPLESAIALFRSKWWLIGFAVAAVAWGFHVIAMALAPLSMVQVVTAGGLALLALPAQKFFGIRLGRREWAGLCLSAFGLAWLAVTAEASEVHSAYSLAALLAFEGAPGRRRRDAPPQGLEGAQPRAKRRHARRRRRHHDRRREASRRRRSPAVLPTSGVIALVSPWSILTVCAGLLAFFALARGLQIGPPIQVIALSSIAANVTGIAGGILVFGDSIGADALGIIARAAAFAAVIAAAVLIPAPRTSEGTPAVA